MYIIYSPTLDQYYTGHTADLEDRLFRHRNSGSSFTKKVHDWELVYIETFSNKSSAFKREMEVKKKKSRKYIEALIGQNGEE